MTHLFHVDESFDDNYHFHVGVLSTGEATAAVEVELDDIVDVAFADGACRRQYSELHGYEIHSMTGEWKRATPDRAVQVFDDVLALLAKTTLK